MGGPIRPDTIAALVGRRGRSRPALLAAAAAGSIVASVALLTYRQLEARSPIGRLAAVVGPHRVTAARLTGPFGYAPCTPATPNDSLVSGLLCADSSPREWARADELAELVGVLRASEGDDPARGGRAGERRHASGLWYIVWANADAAIDALRTAVREDPSNAAVRSDLAAALLQRAELKQDPVSLLDAYTAVDSALALDPGLPAARFNRALVLERLHLERDAIAAWSAYLEADPRSDWAAEARAGLDRLRTPRPTWSVAEARLDSAVAAGDAAAIDSITRRFPWRVRDQARATILEWASARLARRAAGPMLARRAEALGRALQRTTGDVLWAEVAGALVASPGGAGARVDAIARGLDAYAHGRAALDGYALDLAQRQLRHAARTLAEAGSPAAHWAEYDLARVSYQRHTSRDYGEAVAMLRRILATAPDEYRALRAMAVRNVGFVEHVRANYDAAASAYAAAIAEGREIGEPTLELRTAVDAADLTATLAGDRAAWPRLYRAFRAAERYPDAPNDAQRLFARAVKLSWQRFPAVAALFQRESVRLTSLARDSVLMIYALAREAELLGRVGEPDEALERLRQARALAAEVENDSIRALVLADADLIDGEVWIRERPDSAIPLLQQAVARYRATDYLALAARARLLLANAYAATGAGDSARRVFEDALAELERQRADLAAFEDRARFLDRARPVIDSVVRFLVGQRDTVGALDFLERMRARVLLERTRRADGRANVAHQPVETVRRSLRERTTIVSYAALDQEVIAWSIHRDGIAMARTRVAGGLQPLVERFSALIAARGGGREVQAAAARLYDVLIAPLEESIPRDSRLVLVPDKWLHFVPFSALFDARRGRFLVESHEIGIAPSVELFHEASVRAAAMGETDQARVLAVGNPSFDRNAYALPLLPGAEREAAAVADRYPAARLLIGAAATRGAFLREAASAGVIHFAGHGVVSAEAPMMSQLVLAAGSGETGALYAKDIFELQFPNTRLAILSGCQTAGGDLSGTEGVSSLARALLAAGVPTVIASLWAVDDDQTADFFAAYHAQLARDGDPGAALRRTQVQWLNREGGGWRAMSTWAAFQLFGATGGRTG